MAVFTRATASPVVHMLSENEKRVLLYIGDGKRADAEGYTPAKTINDWAEEGEDRFLAFHPSSKLVERKVIQQPPGTRKEKFGLTELGTACYEICDEERRAHEISAKPEKPKQEANGDDSSKKEAGGDPKTATDRKGLGTDKDGKKSTKAGGAGT